MRRARSGNKYRNIKQGGNDSKRESRRATELRLMQRAGLISGLVEKRRWSLIPAQYIDGRCVERAVTYTSDFDYTDYQTEKYVVEDSKGARTQQYVLRRKMMLFFHNISILET